MIVDQTYDTSYWSRCNSDSQGSLLCYASLIAIKMGLVQQAHFASLLSTQINKPLQWSSWHVVWISFKHTLQDNNSLFLCIMGYLIKKKMLILESVTGSLARVLSESILCYYDRILRLEFINKWSLFDWETPKVLCPGFNILDATWHTKLQGCRTPCFLRKEDSAGAVSCISSLSQDAAFSAYFCPRTERKKGRAGVAKSIWGPVF